MTLRELVDELERILKVHPEAGEARVWTTTNGFKTYPIGYVGYDKRHHPSRINLEEG